MSSLDGIDALIRDLSDLQKDVEVEDLLSTAQAEPEPVEDRFRQMEQVMETFRSLSGTGADPARDLYLLQNMGRTYERFLNLQKAYDTYTEALKLAEQQEDAGACALLLCRIGRVMLLWSRWETALEYLDRSQKAYEALKEEQGLARVASNRGEVFMQRGEYDAAEEAYREGLGRARTAGDRGIEVNVLNNLAVLSTIRGDLDAAVSQYESCLKTCREIGNIRGQARAYHNLGMTHADRQDWNAAMKCYELGFEIARENQQFDVMANIHLARAEVLLELGDTSLVALCCARAFDVCRKIGNRVIEADAYRLMGRLFTLRGRWHTAESMFRDSLRLSEEYSNPLGAAEAHRDLGKMAAARGQAGQAYEAFEVARNRFQALGAMRDVAEMDGLLQARTRSEG